MKLWIKISSENRRQGAWFYDLEDAKTCARSWERLIPVEFKDWPNTQDDNDHSRNGESADKTFPDLVDEAYRKGFSDGAKYK